MSTGLATNTKRPYHQTVELTGCSSQFDPRKKPGFAGAVQTDQVFQQISVKNRSLVKEETAARVCENQITKNQQEQQKLRMKLDKLRELSDKLTADSAKLEQTGFKHRQSAGALQSDINGLRFWAPAMALSDLPDEVLVVIFTYLDYEHQQRLVRVSREWKNKITGRLDHIYWDNTKYNSYRHDRLSRKGGKRSTRSRFVAELASTPSPLADWKYRCQTVTAVTFNCLFRVGFRDDCALSLKWLRRFPNYTRLNIINLHMPKWDLLRQFCEPSRSTRITIHNAIITAFPQSFGSLSEVHLHSSSLSHYWKRIPDITFSSGDDCCAELDRMAENALSSPENIAWIAKYAPLIKTDMVQRIFHGLHSYPTNYAITLNYYHPTYPPATHPNTLCPEHNQLCQHLPASFYLTNFDGRVRSLLQLLIHRLNVPTEEPVPCCESLYGLGDQFQPGPRQLRPEPYGWVAYRCNWYPVNPHGPSYYQVLPPAPAEPL